MRIKKILAATFIALTPGLASAGIFADLGSMVMSNTTAPGTLSTKDRTGVFMGGFAMRTPIQPVNLVTFDPLVLTRDVVASTFSVGRSASSTASS